MKILAIRGCNLASLAGEFEIDLANGALGAAGVFAIVGNTGAGKSTLLDALCVALFDRTPRLTNHSRVVVGRGEEDPGALGAQDVRTLLRRGASQGWAEVDFEAGDARRYRARWSVRRARGQIDGTIQSQQVSLTTLDGGERLGGTKTETLEAIHRRLGLTFDQFRRSALLAQGEFAAFLRADGKDRSELLERMTGTSIYTRLSVQAHLRATLAEQQLAAGRTAAFAIAVLDDAARGVAESDRRLADDARLAARARHAAAEATERWVREANARGDALAVAERARAEAVEADVAAEVERAELALRRRAEALRAPWEEAERRDRELSLAHAAVVAAEAAAQTAADNQRAIADRRVAVAAIHEPLRAARIAARLVERPAPRRASHAEALALGRTALDDAAWLTERVALASEIAGWAELDARFAQHAAAVEAVHGHDEALKRHEAERVKLQRGRTAHANEQHAALGKLSEAQRKVGEFQKRRGLTLDAARKLEDEARTRLTDVERLVATGDEARAAQGARDDADRRVAELAAAAEADVTQRGAAEAARITARAVRVEREHALGELRKAAGYEHARAELVDGEACPLCGAEEHPWAGRGAFHDVIAAAKARVDEIIGEIDRATVTISTVDARAEQRTVETAALGRARAAAVGAAASAAARWADQLAALGELSLVRDPLAPGAEDFGGELLAAAKRKLDEAKMIRSQTEAATKAAADAQADVTLCQAALDAAQLRLVELDKKIADVDATIGRIAGERAGRDERRAEVEAELDAAIARWSAAAGGTAPRAKGKGVREHLRAWIGDLAIAWGARGERVAEAEAVLASALLALDGEARGAEAIVGETAGRRVDATVRRDDAIEELAGAAATIEQARAEAGFDAEELRRLLSAPPERVEELVERIAMRARAVELARALVAERQRLVAEHAEVRPASLDDAADVPSLAAALGLAEEHAARAAAVLAADDDARTRRAAALALLEAAEAAADVDRVLGEVIGSHDGKKFRSFAQSLTLDGLLAVANAHLEELAPRYQLERVPNHDLELQVIDRDLGEEVRSVQSLSGGESFLVSLALALGLSSMSAHDVRVRTLLIDEGFGTLDPATLDTALAVLDTLQSQGRQVGVISHVPQLIERVGAHVRVEPRGGGRSEVIVA